MKASSVIFWMQQVVIALQRKSFCNIISLFNVLLSHKSSLGCTTCNRGDYTTSWLGDIVKRVKVMGCGMLFANVGLDSHLQCPGYKALCCPLYNRTPCCLLPVIMLVIVSEQPFCLYLIMDWIIATSSGNSIFASVLFQRLWTFSPLYSVLSFSFDRIIKPSCVCVNSYEICNISVKCCFVLICFNYYRFRSTEEAICFVKGKK